MFDNENRALRRAVSAPRWTIWDVSSEAKAREAARAGWLVAAAQVVLSLIGGLALGAAGGSRTLFVILGTVVFAILLAGLAWIIRARQPRWASVVLLVWMLLQTASVTLQAPVSISMGITLGLTVLAVLSVRGAFSLANFKRKNLTPDAAGQVFD